MTIVLWNRLPVETVFLTDQNQKKLLVICQIDKFAPAAVTGGQDSLALTRDVNFDTQSTDISAEGIREVIPVPDGLRKETAFISICLYTSRGYLQYH